MNSFPKLNIPLFELNIKSKDGQSFVFDGIRKDYFLLTPEEWVRQQFLQLLIQNFKYPKSLIKIETGLRYNKLLKRSDIIVYNRQGKPFLLVECKSADQKLTQAGLEQVSVYNKTIQAEFIVLTNGLKTLCCKINPSTSKYEFIPNLPDYPIAE